MSVIDAPPKPTDGEPPLSVEDASMAATQLVTGIQAPSPRRERWPFGLAIGIGGIAAAIAIAYWRRHDLEWMFGEFLPYAQITGSLILWISILRLKDWIAYKTHGVRYSLIAAAILFAVLAGLNQCNDKAKNAKRDGLLEKLAQDLKQIKDDVGTNAQKNSKALEEIKTTAEKRDAKLEKLGELSDKELAIKYQVSVDVLYSGKNFHIHNKGNTNISLWGTKMGDGPRSIEKVPRLISPGGSYYLVAEHWHKDLVSKLKPNDETRGMFEIYLKDDLQREVVLKCMLWVVNTNGELTVHTQNTGAVRTPWSR